MRECIVKARDLRKIYTRGAEEIGAVRGVDLEVNSGDFIAIMGPSGSGKTTLLDLIGCLENPSGGRLEVLGRDISEVKERSLVSMRRGKIGFIFQQFLLIPTLTALENVMLPLSFARRPEERGKAVSVLEKVGLGLRLNHLPRELSGGERQRVAIARALAISPKLILADEPTGNLDTKSSQQIFNIFKQLNRDEGITIVAATHNPKLGLQASRIVYIQDGKIVPENASSLK